MILTAQEIAAKLHEHNRWGRGLTEHTTITPRELSAIIDAAIKLLNEHPWEWTYVDDTGKESR